jgi:secreted trypsin-like serine protease
LVANEEEEVSRHRRRLENRIVGGRVANPMRFAYYTYLNIDYESGLTYLCGGSLVAPDMILTAAHCIYPSDDPIIKITAIVNYTQTTKRQTGFEYIRRVTKQIQYPKYNWDKSIGDVALLLLQRAVTGVPLLNLNNVSTVPLVGQSLTVLGFGDTSPGKAVFPKNLLEVSVPAVSQQDCNDDNSYQGTIVESAMLCAGFEMGGKDSCGGDSGGPLIVPGASAKDDILVGVVSFGRGCALANLPGVYTRISTYQTWIKESICQSSQSPPLSCQSSVKPRAQPTVAPIRKLTLKPTRKPPSKNPTHTATRKPSKNPTHTATRKPSKNPTQIPTRKQPLTHNPTFSPTEAPIAPSFESPAAESPKDPISTPVIL